MGRRRATAGWIAAALLVVLASASAEPLPERGTFEGVYHVDRWGRASISFFTIPEALRSRFEGMEGKYVRFEVLDGEQTLIPGPVRVKALGAVATIADEPQVAVSISIFPATPLAGERATVVATVRNAGAHAVEWATSHAGGDDLCELGSEVPAAKEAPRAPHLSQRSLHAQSQRWSSWNVLQRLDPGDSQAIVLESGALEAGRHEFSVTPSVGQRHFPAWKAIDVLPAGTPRWGELAAPTVNGVVVREVAAGLDTTGLYRQESDGRAVLALDWVLKADPAPGPRLSWGWRRGGHGRTTRVALHAFGDGGREFPVSTWTAIVEGSDGGSFLENGDWDERAWTLAPLPDGGLRLHAVLWPATAFPPPQPWRLVAEVSTSEGRAQATVIRGEFPELSVVQVPFGEERERVRLRARPAVDPMPSTGRRAVFLEAVNSGDVPIALLPPVPWEDRVVVEIDGRAGPIEAGQKWYLGWAASQTLREPQQGVVHLREGWRLDVGEHVLRVGIRSPGGTHPNASNEPIHVLDGDLWSAPVRFSVR